MAYIGKQPVIGNFVKLDAISVVNGQASYTMQNGGANFTAYANVNQFLVSLNGILQSPTTSFTVSGSTITFASNLLTGDVIDFIIVLGNTLDVGVPSDNTVSLAKLTATGTKDATTFLRGDNTFAEAGGGIEMVDMWRLTTSFTGNANPIASNLERVDTYSSGFIGTGMTESSGIFTFPSTGIYSLFFQRQMSLSGDDRAIGMSIQVTTNNSTYNKGTESTAYINQTSGSVTYANSTANYIFDVTNTTTHKVRFSVDVVNSSTTTLGDTSTSLTHMIFIKLGDT